MKTESPPLIGPAASVLEAARAFFQSVDRGSLLLNGNPGVGKTALSDQLALQLTGNRYAIEHINGQSLGIELVRSWRERGCYGNLFSDWTVKRIDELDHASSSAVAELLSYLDYLPPRTAIIATTNDYTRLQAANKGRLESRFVRFQVDAPSIQQTARHLIKLLQIPKDAANAIATGSVPEGCLTTEGCNVRSALNDARGFIAARAAQQFNTSTIQRSRS